MSDGGLFAHQIYERGPDVSETLPARLSSLKKLAKAYGISYPTVRLRLDRLIEKVHVIDDNSIASEFERTLRLSHTEGRLDMATLKVLLATHHQELDGAARGS